jgi:hypothetical protein
MSKATIRPVALVALIAVALVGVLAPPAQALPTPSKTAADQSLAERAADLAVLEAVLDQEEVTAALAAQGLSRDDVNTRLAQLSPEELAGLSSQVEQLQAAGQPTYVWVLIAVLAVVAIVAIAS